MSKTAKFAFKIVTDTVSDQKTGTIPPGGVLLLSVRVPDGCLMTGGGAHCQELPVGSATNYVLKSSYPVVRSDGQFWYAVFTNTYNDMHPQVVTFTVTANYIKTA